MQLRPNPDASEKSVRVITRRLVAGGVLCLALLSILAWVVSVPRDRTIAYVPVDASLYVSAKRAPTVFEATVPGDEIIKYIFGVTKEKFSTTTELWLERTASQSRRVSFAQFPDVSGVETSVLLFDVVEKKDLSPDVPTPTYYRRIGEIEIVGETQSALDVINDVESKKILSLASQRTSNYFFADGEFFIRPSTLVRLSGYILPSWVTTFSREENLWLQLDKKSDHWEFASRKPYLLGSALHASSRRIMPNERVHWYGVDATRMFTDSSYPLTLFLRPFNDALAFARASFAIDTLSVLSKMDREGEVIVFDGNTPDTVVIIQQPDEKIHTQLNELLRVMAAYFDPSNVIRTLPDKTTVTELVVDKDQWQWSDAPMKLLSDAGGHVVLAQRSKNSSLYFSNSTSTLASVLADTGGVAWSAQCPVASYAKDVLVLRLTPADIPLNFFPFQYIAVVPTIGSGVVGCFFNL